MCNFQQFKRFFLSILLLFYFTGVTVGLEFLHTHHPVKICKEARASGRCLHKAHLGGDSTCQICAAHYCNSYLRPAVVRHPLLLSILRRITYFSECAGEDGFEAIPGSRGPPVLFFAQRS